MVEGVRGQPAGGGDERKGGETLEQRRQGRCTSTMRGDEAEISPPCALKCMRPTRPVLCLFPLSFRRTIVCCAHCERTMACAEVRPSSRVW